MRKIIVLSLGVVILLGMLLSYVVPVIAQETRFIAQQNTNFDIKEPCYNNGTYCSSGAVCNISVWMPNEQTILVDGGGMTNRGTFHNYTLNTSQTNILGDYEASITCTDGSLSNFDSFAFKVTPSGQTYQEGEATIYAIALASMLLFVFFFILLSNATETPGVKLFFLLCSFVLVLFSAGAVRVLLDYTSFSGGIINIITGLIWLLAVIFIIVMYVVFINQTRQALQLWKARAGFGDIENAEMF